MRSEKGGLALDASLRTLNSGVGTERMKSRWQSKRQSNISRIHVYNLRNARGHVTTACQESLRQYQPRNKRSNGTSSLAGEKTHRENNVTLRKLSIFLNLNPVKGAFQLCTNPSTSLRTELCTSAHRVLMATSHSLFFLLLR